MKQTQFASVTDKRSVPFNANGTGTIVTFGEAVVGTGTLFKTEMLVGSYIVSESQGECRRVRRVDSDTSAFLEIPFTIDLVSAAPSLIKWFKAKPVEIIFNYVSGTVVVDGVTLTKSVTLSKASRDRSSRKDFIEPIIVDSTSGVVEVTVQY